MYTLRRISSEGVEMNHYLGNDYTVVDWMRSLEAFKKDLDLYFAEYPDRDEFKKTVYAFVSNENGGVQPLFKNQKNYIMGENGNTISNLSII